MAILSRLKQLQSDQPKRIELLEFFQKKIKSDILKFKYFKFLTQRDMHINFGMNCMQRNIPTLFFLIKEERTFTQKKRSQPVLPGMISNQTCRRRWASNRNNISSVLLPSLTARVDKILQTNDAISALDQFRSIIVNDPNIPQTALNPTDLYQTAISNLLTLRAQQYVASKTPAAQKARILGNE